MTEEKTKEQIDAENLAKFSKIKEPEKKPIPPGPKIKDHFATEAEFAQVLSDASSYATGNWEEHFVNAISTRASMWGFDANMSQQEAFKLRQVAQEH